MVDRRVTEDTAIFGANIADGDLLDVVDISDSTDAATGTNKKITALESAVAMGLRLVSLGALGKIAAPDIYANGRFDPVLFQPSSTSYGDGGWFQFGQTTAITDPINDAVTYGAGYGVGNATGQSFAGAYVSKGGGQFQAYIITDGATGAFSSVQMEAHPDVAFFEVGEPATLSGQAAVRGAVNTTRAYFDVTPVLGQTEAIQVWYSAPGVEALIVTPTGILQWTEQSTPAAAPANKVKLYAQDVSGVSRLFIRDDVAAVQLAVASDISALSTVYQPLDSDLTAIAALSTTAYGRAFLALANAAAAATAIDSNTTASTQAIGDAASTGTLGTLARGDHKHAMPAFATNAVVLGSAAAAGSAATLIRSDATIAAFDATSPTTQDVADAAAVGTAAFAARRDHKHAWPSAASFRTSLSVNNTDNTSDATKNSATATLTNKRVTQRVGTTTSSATPTINTDNVDQFNITALAANITSMTTNLSGTPTDGDTLMLRITGDSTPRTIAWGTSFASSGVATLLATTAASKTHHVGLRWDSTAAKWICLAVDATGY